MQLKLRRSFLHSTAGLALVGLVAACATVEKTVVADPGVAFTLPLGKVATVTGNGARITFTRVTDDSRCPIDVECIWAGDARIELTVAPSGSSAETTVISITAPNNEVVVAGMRIRLVSLAPAPRQSEPSAKRAYVAQLIVTPA